VEAVMAIFSKVYKGMEKKAKQPMITSSSAMHSVLFDHPDNFHPKPLFQKTATQMF
jgi:hypothetical protein